MGDAKKCKETCPPRQEWPIIASIQAWSAIANSSPGWKIIRKCPHCGALSEDIEQEEPVERQFS